MMTHRTHTSWYIETPHTMYGASWNNIKYSKEIESCRSYRQESVPVKNNSLAIKMSLSNKYDFLKTYISMWGQMDNKIVSVLYECIVIYEIMTIEFNNQVGPAIVMLTSQLQFPLVLIIQFYKNWHFLPKSFQFI